MMNWKAEFYHGKEPNQFFRDGLVVAQEFFLGINWQAIEVVSPIDPTPFPPNDTLVNSAKIQIEPYEHGIYLVAYLEPPTVPHPVLILSPRPPMEEEEV